MFVEINNAQVVAIENRQIKMNNGDTRSMQIVQLAINTADGIKLEGIEVWDETIERLALAQGQQINLLCKLVSRMWGGRFTYTLRAIKAEQLQTKQEGGDEPF